MEREQLEKLEILAEEWANRAHKGQKRWNGDPYIVHPRRIAKTFDKSVMHRIVSWLHDTVEDTDENSEFNVTIAMIRETFGNEIAFAVDSVTRREDEDETYLAFILRSKVNPVGLGVKIADIKDNLGDGRASRGMRDKYRMALHILTEPVEYDIPWWRCRGWRFREVRRLG